MKKKIITVLSVMLLCMTMIIGAACGGEGGGATTKAVKSIAVATMPTKTEYYVDDTFSAEGGTLTVTYEDDSTDTIAMTAEGVEMTEPDMTKVGNKTITVTYGTKRTRFTISVQNQGFVVTLNYNYTDSTAGTIDVVKGQKATKPTDPTRSGYEFYDWYTDANCTMPFSFDTIITADTTIYAAWKENGATYYEATYSLNYYGEVPSEYKQIVKSGESVKDLPVSPTRAEFTFDGWYMEAAGTTAFTNKTITANTTIYAKWTKTKVAASTYTFEAEQTSLLGKTGPGFSGSAQEASMIVSLSSASGGKCVSYMYANGNSLEFYFASDVAVTDATVTLSLAAELDNISFTSTEFQVIINGTPATYSTVSLVNNSTFSDAITLNSVSLKEGANLIQLKVNNSKRPMGDASTYAATAPMIDCIKITTTAVLAWDKNYNLPMSY